MPVNWPKAWAVTVGVCVAAAAVDVALVETESWKTCNVTLVVAPPEQPCWPGPAVRECSPVFDLELDCGQGFSGFAPCVTAMVTVERGGQSAPLLRYPFADNACLNKPEKCLRVDTASEIYARAAVFGAALRDAGEIACYLNDEEVYAERSGLHTGVVVVLACLSAVSFFIAFACFTRPPKEPNNLEDL